MSTSALDVRISDEKNTPGVVPTPNPTKSSKLGQISASPGLVPLNSPPEPPDPASIEVEILSEDEENRLRLAPLLIITQKEKTLREKLMTYIILRFCGC